MYSKFEKLLEKRNLTAYRVATDLGMSRSTFSNWKRGDSQPKKDKLQKIADYFGVPLSYFYGEEVEQPYFINDEAREMLQQYYESPEKRMLFKATRDLTPEQITAVTNMIKGFKGED